MIAELASLSNDDRTTPPVAIIGGKEEVVADLGAQMAASIIPKRNKTIGIIIIAPTIEAIITLV